MGLYSQASINRFNLKWRLNRGNGCWEWTGSGNGKGYGQIRIDFKLEYAHRVSWQIKNGPVPDGMYVCHACDNRKCVNPSHLWLGSQSENLKDMVDKGRRQYDPEKMPKTKLTPLQVRKIRSLLAEGMKPREISKMFEVSKDTVWNIKVGKTWSHII